VVLLRFILPFAFAALVLSARAAEPSPPELDQKTVMAVEALTRLQNVDLENNPKIKAAVMRVLEKTRGTPSFVKLVQQFKINGQEQGLLDVAARNSTNEVGVGAMRLVLAAKNSELINRALRGTNTDLSLRIAELLGNISDKHAVLALMPLLEDPSVVSGLKRQAIRSLAKTSDGANAILALAQASKLADDLKFAASTELARAIWPEVKQQAAKLLPPIAGQNSQPLPPLSELIKMKGDPVAGARVFNTVTVGCATCHRVKGQGVDFGPDLSEIGTKLGKDALFEAILDPSAGISFGYEAFQVELKSGEEPYGLLASETADELALKAVGGIVTRYKKSDITRKEQMKLSIMPAGLQQTMSTQDLVDLVEYLTTLKKSS
jgi:putative heme-binding domain-containing protein